MWASGRSDPLSRSHEPCLPGVSPFWLVILGLPVIRWPVFPPWPRPGPELAVSESYTRAMAEFKFFFDDRVLRAASKIELVHVPLQFLSGTSHSELFFVLFAVLSVRSHFCFSACR